MWVKICANTNLEDTLAAVHAGADAVGFVFAPSKRQVNAAQVAKIAGALPAGIEKVGVFGADSPADIAHAAITAGLDTVQLHAGFVPETSETLRTLLPPRVGIIQTVHWVVGNDKESATKISEQLRRLAQFDPSSRVLIDAKVGNASGGTGVTFDWQHAATVLATESGLRVILAGGLRPENVSEAIRIIGPWGVDVASGVELSPGKKDTQRVMDFIRLARAG